MRGFAWNLPVAVQFGVGCAEQAMETLQGRRALVLTYSKSLMHESVARLARAASDALVDWIEVPDGLSTMALGRRMAERVWPTLAADPKCVLIGLGGGSVMDVAKWLRWRALDGDPQRLDQLLAASSAPPGWARHELWLLPTTSGTGSEVTRWSTLWDTDSQPPIKRSFDQAHAYADRAVVDPLLSSTCPPTVVLHSALDALGHALEVLWNRHRNPMSVALAEQAAKRIMEALPCVQRDPADLAARSSLALAALEAGVAFSQTRTALAHALSYDLTLEQGVPHGAAVAVWLPLVWRLAVGHSAEVDASLARIFNAPPSKGPGCLHQWFQKVAFDIDLEGLGIQNMEFRVRAALAHERGRNFEGS